MISEHDASLMWRNLFGNGDIEDKTFREARRLLEQLPHESPLRLRLSKELEEIRSLRKSRKEQAT